MENVFFKVVEKGLEYFLCKTMKHFFEVILKAGGSISI
jgi:hypothetical protein